MVAKRNVLRLTSFIFCVVIVVYVIIYLNYRFHYNQNPKFKILKVKKPPAIVIASVVCGDRLNETLTMIKSAVMFSSNAPIKFIIVSEDNLIENLKVKLKNWQLITNSSFSFEITTLSFPVTNSNEWKTLFKPCAAQRLFLPTLLPDIDALLYVDTDTMFMAPPQLVWDLFQKFNSSQLAALSPEHEDPNVGWYNRFAKHPYYGKLGVNSGVMLMNLTRMRQFRWSEYVLPIYQKYKMHITWGDQDIINILFHYQPDKLYIFSCLYNYRPDHCMYMSVCHPAMNDQTQGVVVLHGNRGYFHSMRQPIFHSVYETMFKYRIGTDPYKNFLSVIEKYVESNTSTNCGQVKDLFLVNSKKYITEN